MQSEEATIAIAESNPSADWGRDEVPVDIAAEGAEVARLGRLKDAGRRMTAKVRMAVEQARRAVVRVKEIEREKVTWWRPEPVCTCSRVSTLLKAMVGIWNRECDFRNQ